MSSLTLVTAATVDPVTLGEAKQHCRIDVADDDALLAGYILAARAFVEDLTGRVLMTQTWNLNLDNGWPTVWNRRTTSHRPRIIIPNPPVQSVASITYVDTNGATQALATNQYQLSKGDIFGFIEPGYAVTWPTVRDQLETITVRFIAGYGSNLGDIPEPIRQAILLMVGHFYDNRESTMGGRSISTGSILETPLGVRNLLDNYMTEGWV